jgi:hypothetical protein
MNMNSWKIALGIATLSLAFFHCGNGEVVNPETDWGTLENAEYITSQFQLEEEMSDPVVSGAIIDSALATGGYEAIPLSSSGIALSSTGTTTSGTTTSGTISDPSSASIDPWSTSGDTDPSSASTTSGTVVDPSSASTTSGTTTCDPATNPWGCPTDPSSASTTSGTTTSGTVGGCTSPLTVLDASNKGDAHTINGCVAFDLMEWNEYSPNLRLNKNGSTATLTFEGEVSGWNDQGWGGDAAVSDGNGDGKISFSITSDASIDLVISWD